MSQPQGESPREMLLAKLVEALKGQRTAAMDLAAQREAEAKLTSDLAAGLQGVMGELQKQIAAQDARIKELESAVPPADSAALASASVEDGTNTTH